MQENVFFFLTTKNDVIFFYDTLSIEEGLRLMRKHGFTAMPVIDCQGRYVGTVNEGDFLWYLIDHAKTPYALVKEQPVRNLIRKNFMPAMTTDTTMADLFTQSLQQNFVPIVDDRNIFIGIVTRSNILKYLIEKQQSVVPLMAQEYENQQANG